MVNSKKKKVLIVGNDPSVQRIFSGRQFHVIYDSNKDPDFVVFTGGPDINPELYNEKPLLATHFSDKRDSMDIEHYNQFKDLPKIGICRGSQFLNVMNGGSLWQDVSGHKGEHVAIDVLITKSPVNVTSTHHQMMIPTDKGEVLCIADKSTHYYSDNPDREIPLFDTEVVWYEDTKTLCFQPHPEFKNKGSNPFECRQYFFDLIDYLY